MNSSRDIYFMARANALELSIELFGEPNKALSSKEQVRFGRNGSIKVTVAGEYTGHVSDWSENLHGDIAEFVMRHYGFDQAQTAKYLKDRLSLGVGPSHRLKVQATLPAPSPDTRVTEDTITAAKAAWESAKPFRDSPGHEYLWARLAELDVPETVISCGRLRWSQSDAPGSSGTLVALMHDPATGNTTGVHRTFINDKLEKVGVGLLGKRGAVMLCKPDTTGPLLLAEGLETAISAGMLFGHPKVMAAGSAGALASFPIIDEPSVVVCGDNDPPDKRGRCAGQAAMEECGERWRLAGRNVTTKLPREAGDDFNDMLVRIANGT